MQVYGELESIVDKLATDSQRGSYSVKKTNGASLPRPTSITKNSSTELIINNTSPISTGRGKSIDNHRIRFVRWFLFCFFN